MKYFLISINYLCNSPKDCWKHIAGHDYQKCALCQPQQPIDECVELEEVVGTRGKRWKIKEPVEGEKI